MSAATIRLSKGIQGIAKDLDRKIEDIAGERIGFTLVIFTEGRASYVSNISRAESIREMRHLMDLWEQDMPDLPAHEVD